MRIAIVNDLTMTVEFLKFLVEEEGQHQVAWIARNGAEAVEKCAKDVPDVILMDIIMPVMNGVRATELIMKNSPCAILIVTASVGANASMVFEAMGFGALDVARTPSIISRGDQPQGADLKKKINLIGKYLGMPLQKLNMKLPSKTTSQAKVPPLLIIGASTGGPMALAKTLCQIPEDTPLAIVIIQHIDEQFAEGLADWLDKQLLMKVKLASDGHTPTAGVILIAGRDKHLVLTSNLTLKYEDEPLDIPNRPSVDIFFQSVAQFWPEESMALLLTGMGSDGALGMKALYDKRWHTIAQNQASCIVFGMPKSAIELGGVTEVLPLSDLPARISRFIKNRTIRG